MATERVDAETAAQRLAKLESNARRNWDKFYNRNGALFFKDRHWAERELSEALPELRSEETTVLLECGCGVGNLVFPLVRRFPNLRVYACDFSPRAIQLLQNDERFDDRRMSCFVCDVTSDCLLSFVAPSRVHVCTLVYVLSSIGPDRFAPLLENIAKVLAPGGSVYVRDYAQGDHTEKRFRHSQQLDDHFYVRQDGTRAYFFTIESLCEIFEAVGRFQVRSACYVHRETVNRAKNLRVPRVFVQGVFTVSE